MLPSGGLTLLAACPLLSTPLSFGLWASFLLPAQVPTETLESTPIQALTARELYEGVLVRYRRAQAVHLEGSFRVMVSEHDVEREVRRGSVAARFAKPAHGYWITTEIDPEGASTETTTEGSRTTTTEVLGVGTEILGTRTGSDRYRSLDMDLASSIREIGLSPLLAWAGSELPAITAARLLGPSPTKPHLHGLQFETDLGTERWWIDPEFRVVAASLGPQRAPSHANPRTDFLFEAVVLKNDVDLSQYLQHPRAELPIQSVASGEYEQGLDFAASLLPVGMRAPNVRVWDAEDRPFSLSELRGKTVVLNFWFRECGYCRRELPRLDRLRRTLGDGREDVVFLCVNLGNTRDQIEAYWRDSGFSLRYARQNSDRASRAFGVRGYPSYYLIDPEGRIRHRSVLIEIHELREFLHLEPE